MQSWLFPRNPRKYAALVLWPREEVALPTPIMMLAKKQSRIPQRMIFVLNAIKPFPSGTFWRPGREPSPAVMSGKHGGTWAGRGGRRIVATFFTRGWGVRGSVSSSDVHHDEPRRTSLPG